MIRKLLLGSIPLIAVAVAMLGPSASKSTAASPALPIGQLEVVEDSDEVTEGEEGTTVADRGHGRGFGRGHGWGHGHGRHWHGRHWHGRGHRYYGHYGRWNHYGCWPNYGCNNWYCD